MYVFRFSRSIDLGVSFKIIREITYGLFNEHDRDQEDFNYFVVIIILSRVCFIEYQAKFIPRFNKFIYIFFPLDDLLRRDHQSF